MSLLKTSTSLFAIVFATACESSAPTTQLLEPNPAMPDARNDSSVPVEAGQSGRQLASMKEILNSVSQATPDLVDSTGLSAEHTPGLVVGVVTEAGKEVMGFGKTHIQSGLTPNGDTYFGIGSVTKVFTGLVLADAVQKKIVGLDDSANKYLQSDLKLPTDTITLRQLVTHTSGLPNFPTNLTQFRDLDNDGIADSNKSSPGRNYAREYLSQYLKSGPNLSFKPGQSALYSNLGIGILGIALQSKLNYASFDAMTSAKMTQLLGMKRTQANTPEMQNENLDNKAQGYAVEGAEFSPVPFADMGVLDGAGELVSSANDMLKFLEGMAGISHTPLSSAFTEANRSLSSQGENQMAYASAIVPSGKGGVYYFKPGATPGYSALILWRTQPKIGIVLLSNRGSFKKLDAFGKKLIEDAVR